MITAIVLISVATDSIPEVAEAIAAIDGVSEVYSVAGQVDLIAIVRVRRFDEVADVIAGRVDKVDGVIDTDTHIAFRAYSRHDLEAAFALGFDDPPSLGDLPPKMIIAWVESAAGPLSRNDQVWSVGVRVRMREAGTASASRRMSAGSAVATIEASAAETATATTCASRSAPARRARRSGAAGLVAALRPSCPTHRTQRHRGRRPRSRRAGARALGHRTRPRRRRQRGRLVQQALGRCQIISDGDA